MFHWVVSKSREWCFYNIILLNSANGISVKPMFVEFKKPSFLQFCLLGRSCEVLPKIAGLASSILCVMISLGWKNWNCQHMTCWFQTCRSPTALLECFFSYLHQFESSWLHCWSSVVVFGSFGSCVLFSMPIVKIVSFLDWSVQIVIGETLVLGGTWFFVFSFVMVERS